MTELKEHHNCHKSIPDRQIKLQDVVLIHDKLPRNRWKMGVALELFEGKDGFVRGCKLRTLSKSGRVIYMNRPINKLYPLEIPSEHYADSHKKKQESKSDKVVVEISDSSNSNNNQQNLIRNTRPIRAAAERGILKRLQNN